MPMENENFIELRHVGFSYYGDDDTLIPVLHDVSLTVKKGEFVAILGHNGSGKSTLSKLINMVLTEDDGKITGEILVDGVCVNAENVTEDLIYAVRRKVGMVFQNPDNQLVATTVEEDVAFGPENLGIPHDEMVERVDRALSAVKMTEYRIHAPHKLSGGQKQRVAIAGVLAMEPGCIIFDESTAMLDPLGRREVMDAILKLNREKGITVLLITHYMNEATEADRVFVLNEGQIFLSGTPSDVFSQVEKLQSVRLDAPQVTELCHLLMGSDGSEPLPLHTDAAADAIAAYLGLSEK